MKYIVDKINESIVTQRYLMLETFLNSMNNEKYVSSKNDTINICKEYNLKQLSFTLNRRNNSVIALDMIESNDNGAGTEFMKDLCKYADNNKRIITLSPIDIFVGKSNYKRLIEFYKKFGFRETTHKDNKYTHNKMIRYYGNK